MALLGTTAAVLFDHGVHELVFEQLKRNPNKVALVQDGREVSGADLMDLAFRTAVAVSSWCTGPETFIGIHIENSVEAVAAILGVLRVGAAYVPLDPSLPKERLERVVRHAGLKGVVTRTPLSSALPDDLPQIAIDRDLSPSERPCQEISVPRVTSDAPAYVLYTSGSTGEPKGIVGLHRSILNGLLSVSYSDGEICCLSASLSFGLSLANLFLPLILGLRLIVMTDNERKDIGTFLKIVERERVTRIVLIPAIFKQVLSLGSTALDSLRNVRVVSLVGSEVTPELLKLYMAAIPWAQFLNTYACTEVGTLATVWRVDRDLASSEVSIGWPVANTRVYILDDRLRSVAVGQIGEICVAAPHLARGYLNSPQETSERFTRDPFGNDGSWRIFRTGDVGRMCSDGSFQYVSRMADFVKVRGFRIVLGDIETAIRRSGFIKDVAVLNHGKDDNGRIVAYLVPVTSDCTVLSLRTYLREALPDYMIPSAFVFLDAIPLTDSGKVDKIMLQNVPIERPELGVEYSEPTSHLENELSGFWSELLGIGDIGVTDPFLELGGDSLFTVQLAARISKAFQLEISLETLFELSTIRQMGVYIAEHAPGWQNGPRTL